MHSDRCSEHHACAGVYVKLVLRASAYTFADTLATECAYALIYRVIPGNRNWQIETADWNLDVRLDT